MLYLLIAIHRNVFRPENRVPPSWLLHWGGVWREISY